MRIAIALGIVLVAASSCLTAAEARGRRGGGGGGWGSAGSLEPVRGSTRRDGTVVAPSLRTRADGDPTNNRSTRGSGGTSVGSYTRTASADPTASVESLSQPVAPLPRMPWCSDGAIISGVCVLN